MTMDMEWAQLSPEEKREERFNGWLNPQGVRFVNPEAENAKVIDALINEGIQVSLFAEGSYKTRLDGKIDQTWEEV
jgi:pyridoxine 5'-phosphate synthase PdxJ